MSVKNKDKRRCIYFISFFLSYYGAVDLARNFVGKEQRRRWVSQFQDWTPPECSGMFAGGQLGWFTLCAQTKIKEWGRNREGRGRKDKKWEGKTIIVEMASEAVSTFLRGDWAPVDSVIWFVEVSQTRLPGEGTGVRKMQTSVLEKKWMLRSLSGGSSFASSSLL